MLYQHHYRVWFRWHGLDMVISNYHGIKIPIFCGYRYAYACEIYGFRSFQAVVISINDTQF
jgi:hypothetical protein